MSGAGLDSSEPAFQVSGSKSGPGASNIGPRRTPRRSLIVVLPENHIVAPERVVEHLTDVGGQDVVDVIVACAGPSSSLAALQRRVRDIQVLLAPAGTSVGDLRELAMKQSPGDIVTLVSGIEPSSD
jgi:hypothetical protein